MGLLEFKRQVPQVKNHAHKIRRNVYQVYKGKLKKKHQEFVIVVDCPRAQFVIGLRTFEHGLDSLTETKSLSLSTFKVSNVV